MIPCKHLDRTKSPSTTTAWWSMPGCSFPPPWPGTLVYLINDNKECRPVASPENVTEKSGGDRVAGGMSRMAKQELLETIRDRYQAASRQEKSRIFDEFIAVTGHHRKHGIRLLGRPVGGEDQGSRPA